MRDRRRVAFQGLAPVLFIDDLRLEMCLLHCLSLARKVDSNRRALQVCDFLDLDLSEVGRSTRRRLFAIIFAWLLYSCPQRLIQVVSLSTFIVVEALADDIVK